MANKPKQYDDDDGRVICDMDVDGMRWHDRQVRREKRAERRASTSTGDPLTKSQARRFTMYAVLAGLTIVAVYAVVWAIVLLFMTQVWFR
jgi:uncharacterized membrane protein